MLRSKTALNMFINAIYAKLLLYYLCLLINYVQTSVKNKNEKEVIFFVQINLFDMSFVSETIINIYWFPPKKNLEIGDEFCGNVYDSDVFIYPSMLALCDKLEIQDLGSFLNYSSRLLFCFEMNISLFPFFY